MLTRLTIKNEYYLIAAAIVMTAISYQLAFKHTLDAWRQYQQLNKQLQLADPSFQPAYELRRSSNLSKILSAYRADTSNFRSDLISNIAVIADNEQVKLSDLPVQDPFFQTDKFIIQRLSFSGDYFALLKTLNRLQKTPGIGVIRSVTIKTERTSNKLSTIPTMTVFFEVLR